MQQLYGYNDKATKNHQSSRHTYCCPNLLYLSHISSVHSVYNKKQKSEINWDQESLKPEVEFRIKYAYNLDISIFTILAYDDYFIAVSRENTNFQHSRYTFENIVLNANAIVIMPVHNNPSV